MYNLFNFANFSTGNLLQLHELTPAQTPQVTPRHFSSKNGNQNLLVPPPSGICSKQNSTKKSHLRKIRLPEDSPKNNSFGFSFRSNSKEVRMYWSLCGLMEFLIFYFEGHSKIYWTDSRCAGGRTYLFRLNRVNYGTSPDIWSATAFYVIMTSECTLFCSGLCLFYAF